jgi:toxin ParE1/3/4
MASVIFSPRSRQDLIDIGDFVTQDSRANARRFVASLQDRCKRIGDAPLSYPSRDDLAAGLRMAPLGRYVIFFRVLDDTVRIERLLHGACNLPVMLAPD